MPLNLKNMSSRIKDLATNLENAFKDGLKKSSDYVEKNKTKILVFGDSEKYTSKVYENLLEMANKGMLPYKTVEDIVNRLVSWPQELLYFPSLDENKAGSLTADDFGHLLTDNAGGNDGLATIQTAWSSIANLISTTNVDALLDGTAMNALESALGNLITAIRDYVMKKTKLTQEELDARKAALNAGPMSSALMRSNGKLYSLCHRWKKDETETYLEGITNKDISKVEEAVTNDLTDEVLGQFPEALGVPEDQLEYLGYPSYEDLIGETLDMRRLTDVKGQEPREWAEECAKEIGAKLLEVTVPSLQKQSKRFDDLISINALQKKLGLDGPVVASLSDAFAGEVELAVFTNQYSTIGELVGALAASNYSPNFVEEVQGRVAEIETDLAAFLDELEKLRALVSDKSTVLPAGKLRTDLAKQVGKLNNVKEETELDSWKDGLTTIINDYFAISPKS